MLFGLLSSTQTNDMKRSYTVSSNKLATRDIDDSSWSCSCVRADWDVRRRTSLSTRIQDDQDHDTHTADGSTTPRIRLPFLFKQIQAFPLPPPPSPPFRGWMLFLKPNTIECFDLACFFETGPGWMLRGREGLLEIGEVVFSR